MMVAWRKENELRICSDRLNVEGKKVKMKNGYFFCLGKNTEDCDRAVGQEEIKSWVFNMLSLRFLLETQRKNAM